MTCTYVLSVYLWNNIRTLISKACAVSSSSVLQASSAFQTAYLSLKNVLKYSVSSMHIPAENFIDKIGKIAENICSKHSKSKGSAF